MQTKKQVLVTMKPDRTVEIIPMRYNATHQRGWRCFVGSLAEDAGAIVEDTVPSFSGRSLFDALADYRATIEPSGGRLLQAMASSECWPDEGTFDRYCRRFTPGTEATELVDGFLPIAPDEAATLEGQRANYEAWRSALATDALAVTGTKSRAMQALNESNAAIRATREAAILARGDLAPRKTDTC